MNKSTACNMRSLRDQAEKWLTAGSDTTLHVLLFGRTADDGHRYVCVEARHLAGAHALFFFRDDDGRWDVFPRSSRQPMMAGKPVDAPS